MSQLYTEVQIKKMDLKRRIKMIEDNLRNGRPKTFAIKMDAHNRISELKKEIRGA